MAVGLAVRFKIAQLGGSVVTGATLVRLFASMRASVSGQVVLPNERSITAATRKLLLASVDTHVGV